MFGKMPPASLLNSCSLDIMHPYADLCTIQSLWADWVRPHCRGSSREEGNQDECHPTA